MFYNPVPLDGEPMAEIKHTKINSNRKYSCEHTSSSEA